MRNRVQHINSLILCMMTGCISAMLFSTAAFCSVGEPQASNDFTELSLEALMDIKVTSISKKPQRLATAAAAAFVITQEDIRRSGATTIPDLLRMVPGVQVAQIDANKWAVSIRGFNGRFANKLLVLQDGRSIYTPLFSGVYWEHQQTPLEDIERIEVIRGPSAALWGANAVNGVINIITKHAGDTHGGMVAVRSGTQDNGSMFLRYGASINESNDVRVYGSFSDHDPGVTASGTASHDGWQHGSGGFRMDSRLSSTDSLTLQGDFFSGSYDELYSLYTLSQPGVPQVVPSSATANGFNLLGRWQRSTGTASNIALQLYYDHYQRTIVELGETRDTVDLEFQQRSSIGSRQDLVWGIGYRYTQDQLKNSPYITFHNTNDASGLMSAFLHDEISLVPDQLTLTLGARLEHNEFSGFEVQPDARLIWSPNSSHSFWAALSRAVRTPSRGDDNITYRFLTLPGPVQLEINGNSSFKSEVIRSYEVGYRTALRPSLSMDLALFVNQYRHLRVPISATPYLESAYTVVPATLSNDMHGYTYGLEISASWRIYEWWRMQASYSYLDADMTLDAGVGQDLAEINRADAASGAPKHQGSIYSGFDLGRQIELGVWLRAVGRVDYIDQASIPGYVTTDARIAWKPVKSLELSIVGQNLLQNRHREYIPEFINTTASEVPRACYAKAVWKF